MMDGFPAFMATSIFGDANNFTKSFSNKTSKSLATPLTDLEGDDIRFRMGNINNSSSLRSHVAPPNPYSAKESDLVKMQ